MKTSLKNLPIWRCLIVLLVLTVLSFPSTAVQAQGSQLTFAPNWDSQMYIGDSWSILLAANGGTAPYSYAVTAGGVAGIQVLNTSGIYHYQGTPTTAGTFSVTITVTDSAVTPVTVSASHTYIVPSVLALAPSWGEQMFVGDPWSATFSATGSSGNYSYNLSLGSIPGLSFSGNTSSATYSGTPTSIGTYPIVVSVHDFLTPQHEATANHTYTVKAHTTLQIDHLASGHPDGDLRVGYPIWVVLQLDASEGISLPESPSPLVIVSSGSGGPTCTATINPDGSGECVLYFATTGSFSLSADYAGAAYFDSANVSQTMQVLANDRSKVLSAGRNHTCQFNESGQILCWGLEDSYTIKDSHGNILSDVSQGTYVQMSAGGYHTCAIDSEGAIHCWGDTVGITNPVIIPNTIGSRVMHYISIDAGDDHVCAIDTNYRLHCWGEILNEIQAGIPTTAVKAVSVGETNDCVVNFPSNTVSCWGLNNNNQLAVPATLIASRIDTGTTHTCAIRTSDSHIVCWGTPAMTFPAISYKEIGSGANYTCGLTSANQLRCQGSNALVSQVPTALMNTFSAGLFHSCAIQSGTGGPFLKCWGINEYDQSPSLSLAPLNLPSILPMNQPWSTLFTASGGGEPYNLSVGGTLPVGISLNGFQLGGTPTTINQYNFSIQLNETFPLTDEVHPLKLAPLSADFSIIIRNPATSIQINSADSNIPMGSPVNVTTTINKISAAAQPAIAGSVTITAHETLSGRTMDCSATVVDHGTYGTASCPIFFGEAGDDQIITAVYNGDSFYLPSNNTASSNTKITPIVIDPAISAGNGFNCSINSSGSPTCWGDNDSGQSNPLDDAFKSLDAGDSHVCAVGVSSQISCWGWNGFGVVSNRVTNYGYTSVTSGQSHSCSLDYSGVIHCWGANTLHQLNSPTSSGFTQIDAGDQHTCALDSSAHAICWGSNSSGQLNVPSDTTFLSISAGGNSSCGITSSNALLCWGGSASFRAAVPVGSFLTVSNGYAHACAIDNNHHLNCWGDFSTVISGSYSKVAAGKDHNCALTQNDGFLKCWGSNTLGQAPAINIQPVELPVLSVNQAWSIQLSASGSRSPALTFYKIGDLPNGLTLTSSGLLSGTPVSGNDFTFSIRVIEANLSPALVQEITYTQRVKANSLPLITAVNGTEMTAGKPITITSRVNPAANSLFTNLPGGVIHILVNGQEVCSKSLTSSTASCEVFFTTAGQKSVVVRYDGDSRYLPADSASTPFTFDMADFSQIARIITGKSETYIHKSDGSLMCWGAQCQLSQFNGLYTAFGVGDEITCALQLNGEIKCLHGTQTSVINGQFAALSVGNDHACALNLQGEAVCWGGNDFGQSSPPTGAYSKIDCGQAATCAIRADDQRAECWGNLTIPAPTQALQSVSVGNGHACGLTASGEIACWGDNSNGQTSSPAGSDYSLVTSGGQHGCALNLSGGLTCWGVNEVGQILAPYGIYADVDAYGNHACAMRSSQQISCWGENEFGEAPRISVTPLAADNTVVNQYFEHFFNPTGGIRPYQAVIVSGSLPKDLSLEPLLSPAGVVLYGTPMVPARYNFILRWTDMSTPQRVLDVPYQLTITGADLAVDIMPAHAQTALKGIDFYFDYVIHNHTPLDIPQVDMMIDLPASGWQDALLEGVPECAVSDTTINCHWDALPASSQQTLRVRFQVTGEIDEVLATSAAIYPTLSNWPEINPLDNQDAKSVTIAYSSVLLDEDFGDDPSDQWSGGSVVEAPLGERYLQNNFPSSQEVRLFFDRIAPHARLHISFDLHVLGDWQGNGSASFIDPALFVFGPTGGSALTLTTFCTQNDCMQAFPVSYPGGSHPAFTSAASVGELGYDPNDLMEARYHLVYTFIHRDETLDLTWLAENLQSLSRFGLDNVLIELDAHKYIINLPMVIK